MQSENSVKLNTTPPLTFDPFNSHLLASWSPVNAFLRWISTLLQLKLLGHGCHGLLLCRESAQAAHGDADPSNVLESAAHTRSWNLSQS